MQAAASCTPFPSPSGTLSHSNIIAICIYPQQDPFVALLEVPAHDLAVSERERGNRTQWQRTDKFNYVPWCESIGWINMHRKPRAPALLSPPSRPSVLGLSCSLSSSVVPEPNRDTTTQYAESFMTRETMAHLNALMHCSVRARAQPAFAPILARRSGKPTPSACRTNLLCSTPLFARAALPPPSLSSRGRRVSAAVSAASSSSEGL